MIQGNLRLKRVSVTTPFCMSPDGLTETNKDCLLTGYWMLETLLVLLLNFMWSCISAQGEVD